MQRHFFYIILILFVIGYAHPTVAQGILRDWLAQKRIAASTNVPVPAGAMTVSYGSDALQAYDVYKPVIASISSPIIVMVHGGGWRMGDKAMDRMILNKVARWVPKGFIVISVNYRMLPTADVATQAADVADALADIQKHAATWNADATKMIVMGHSAGAHLVSLIGADTNLRATHHVKPWLGTVSLDSGSMDVPATMTARHFGLYDDAFGTDPTYWQRLSPVHHVSSGSLPWFGVCSSLRADSCPQNNAYAAASVAQHVPAAVHTEKLTHREINENLGLPSGYTTAVENFMGGLDPVIAAYLTP